MPRYPTQSSLPPLECIFPQFSGLEENCSKLQQVSDLLKQAIAQNRTTHNNVFYSTREIARFFGISQNTAAHTLRHLEGEGLLRRVRGSQTLLLGTKVITQSRIRAVAGLLSWDFALRFSATLRKLSHQLAEDLWPHHIGLEIIPHLDIGDDRPDLNERLKKHALDFAIWLYPFEHHREHFLHLNDRGIRNLVIGENSLTSSFPPDVLVDFLPAYESLLHYWREQHGIDRVIVIRPREFAPRSRIEVFAKLAAEMGFHSQVEESTYTLPSEILAREKKPVGIALLDEHSMAEFTFYDPLSFTELLRHHRLLFGEGYLNIPFVPTGEFRIDRIFVPTAPEFEKPLPQAVAKILVRWSAGDYSAPPEKVIPIFWEDGRLWRFL